MRRLAVAGLIGLFCAACGGEPESTRDLGAFPASAPSLEQLGQAVLEALGSGDVDELHAYRLTEFEHNRTVWPELPASAPEVNFPVDLAWMNIDTRNQSALRRVMPTYDGNQPEHERTECRGPTETFRTFVVLTDCWVVFRLAGKSELLEAQLFKDVLVRGGGHKIFRYYDEEPQAYTLAETD